MKETSFKINLGKITPAQAYTMLAANVFLWALGIVIARAVHEEIPPIGLSFWRWSCASLMLFLFVQKELKTKWHIVLENKKIFIVQGMLTVGSGTVMFLALNFTTAINAALVNATQPVMTVLLAWILWKDRLRGTQILGVVAAVLGVGIMISKADWEAISGLNFNVGDFLVVLATLGYSTYAINIRHLPKDLNPFPALCVITTCGSLFILPFYILESLFFRSMAFDWQLVGILFVLAILVSIVAIGMWNIANGVVGPGRAAVFINLIPVYGAFMAILFLGEELFLFHIFGALLVCAGIFMVVIEQRN